MKTGQNIQCQACGASSVTKHQDDSLLECRYCGAMMTYSSSPNSHTENSGQQKPTKLGLMLFILPVLVIVVMVVLWMGFQKIRKQTSVESFQSEKAEKQTITVNEGGNKTSFVPLSKEQAQTDAADSNKPINQYLSIESEVSGITNNGGQYWIFGVKNTGAETLGRPGVMVSLFNEAGQRLVEQGGWSLKDSIKAGEQSTVLVFLSEVPADVNERQINTLASKPSDYGLAQLTLKVQDFNVTNKSPNSKFKQFEIIGDVVNDHEKPVKFVRLLAVAYNASGEPIGTGNAFSTIKNLNPSQGSGFKVRVGTFLTAEPDSWQVRALAREQ